MRTSGKSRNKLLSYSSTEYGPYLTWSFLLPFPPYPSTLMLVTLSLFYSFKSQPFFLQCGHGMGETLTLTLPFEYDCTWCSMGGCWTVLVRAISAVAQQASVLID
ncbi:unnamed protein product, partial [Discosporangium mesarthrocarpum]